MARIYLAYRHNGLFAGAVLAHSPMFCCLVASLAGIEGNYTRETVLIDSESARLIPRDMTGRVLREARVRKLMRLLAPAEERG